MDAGQVFELNGIWSSYQNRSHLGDLRVVGD